MYQDFRAIGYIEWQSFSLTDFARNFSFKETSVASQKVKFSLILAQLQVSCKLIVTLVLGFLREGEQRRNVLMDDGKWILSVKEILSILIEIKRDVDLT